MPGPGLASAAPTDALQMSSGDPFGPQAQALKQALAGRNGADHPSLTLRHGRHSAVTLAGGGALPFWSRSR